MINCFLCSALEHEYTATQYINTANTEKNTLVHIHKDKYTSKYPMIHYTVISAAMAG